MDDKRAKKILENTFKHEFNMENYEYFLTELLNKSDMQAVDKTTYIRKEYTDYVKKFYDLGDYEDTEGTSICLCAVELKKAGSRDRARTMQRNLIAKYIENKHDAALIAFYDSETQDWRFSYVKIETIFTDNRLKNKLSSSKRHSFLVGVNEPNHTCQKQFLDILKNEDKINIDMIDEAFNIENVTMSFFNEYKRLFLELTESLENVKKQDDIVNKEFNEKHIKSSDFAKKLMGQIVFIYFMQKKGWMGIKKNAHWGTGPHNFLRIIFNDSVKKQENFFNDVLEPLFYKGLAEEASDYHYNFFGYKIPFLNGGLFEPINNYNWMDTNIFLKNEVFEEIFNTFDKFNFTIKEDEPLEKEIAVDPEMLGKVFENLLEVNDRKSKGAFYTPRSVVHYMCQNCLIYYLQSHSKLSEDDLRIFIKEGHLAIDSIIRVNEEKRKYNGKQYSKIDLPKSIKEHSDEIDLLLKKVKIVDPAVGSGAFPVGMMNEIVNARYILNLLNGNDFNIYEIKKETIENSLYGVDIEQSATDVTKLRFWLSLIVDEEVTEYIQPLPNLDNHIMCGNSLVDTYHNIKLFDDTLITRSAQRTLSMTRTEKIFHDIERFKRYYFNTNGPVRKQELKNKINKLKWDFIEEYLKKINQKTVLNEIKQYESDLYRPFFIWELEFSEIFVGENPGFDIVIGNPPYVKERTDKKAFDGLKKSPYYQGKMDLWYFFGCKAIDLTKSKGLISFIATNNWITASGASKFRNKVNKEATFKKYIDFGNYKIFNSADIQTMIYIISKDNTKVSYNFIYKKLLDEKLLNTTLDDILNGNYSNSQVETSLINFNREDNVNNYFNFIPKEVTEVLSKIKRNKLVYLTKNEVSQGIIMPQDKLNERGSKQLNLPKNKGIFVLSDLELNELGLSDKEQSLIKPYYTTNELKRYYSNPNNKYWIIYTKPDINKKIEEYPRIKKHLDQFREINTSDYKPYGLHRARDENIFLGEKIIVTRKCTIPTFSYVDFDSYVSQTFMIIKPAELDTKYVLGILNSKLVQFWLNNKGKMQGNNYQLDKKPLLNIPLVVSNKKEEKKLLKLVDDNLKLYSKLNNADEKKDINQKIIDNENKINELVYKIYNLSTNDILIIEKDINK